MSIHIGGATRDISMGLAPFKGGGLTPSQQFDALIAKYSPIYAFNLADAATRWRDTSATLPATIAGTHTLGRLDDKSGNARHVSQATSPSRPTLGNSGDLWWMTGDGTDDWMRSALFTQSQPWWRISALQQISWANSERVFGPAGSGQGYLGQRDSSPTLSLFNGSWAVSNADAAIGADAVVYEVHNGVGSRITVDDGTAATGSPGSSATEGLTVFSDPVGGLPGNIRLYATIAGAGTLTATEAAEIRNVMARLQGRTL